MDDYENRVLSKTTKALLYYLSHLIAMEEFDRLSQILERYKQSLTILPAETLNGYSARLEKCGKPELAQKIRDWTVEEPEEVVTDEE